MVTDFRVRIFVTDEAFQESKDSEGDGYKAAKVVREHLRNSLSDAGNYSVEVDIGNDHSFLEASEQGDLEQTWENWKQYLYGLDERIERGSNLLLATSSINDGDENVQRGIADIGQGVTSAPAAISIGSEYIDDHAIESSDFGTNQSTLLGGNTEALAHEHIEIAIHEVGHNFYLDHEEGRNYMEDEVTITMTPMIQSYAVRNDDREIDTTACCNDVSDLEPSRFKHLYHDCAKDRITPQEEVLFKDSFQNGISNYSVDKNSSSDASASVTSSNAPGESDSDSALIIENDSGGGSAIEVYSNDDIFWPRSELYRFDFVFRAPSYDPDAAYNTAHIGWRGRHKDSNAIKLRTFNTSGTGGERSFAFKGPGIESTTTAYGFDLWEENTWYRINGIVNEYDLTASARVWAVDPLTEPNNDTAPPDWDITAQLSDSLFDSQKIHYYVDGRDGSSELSLEIAYVGFYPEEVHGTINPMNERDDC